MTWFDHNATAPLLPEARAAWLAASDELWRNPSSPTSGSARVHRRYEALRARVAALFGESDSGCVIFNSGATEGNNAVMLAESMRPGSGRVLISAVEHPSVLEPARRWFGDRVIVMPVDADGVLDLAVLESELMRGGVTLVSVMAANNETGVLSPWMRAARLAAAHGARVHTDATQWLGRLPLDGFSQLDYVTAGVHKAGAPKGVGVLLARRCNRDFRGQLGGGQEGGRRAGTEDVAGVAALVAALEAVSENLMRDLPERCARRAGFEAGLRAAVPGVRFVGEFSERLWNTVSVVMPRHANTRWVARLDRMGFQISTGSACAVGSGKTSHVLAAMGLPEDEVRRTVRISAGCSTTAADWSALLAAFAQVASDLDDDAADSSVVRI